MLLARRGYRVLLVDKATFPSDTISTHILWPHGAEALARWGLLGALEATGFRPKHSLDHGIVGLEWETIASDDLVRDAANYPHVTVADNTITTI